MDHSSDILRDWARDRFQRVNWVAASLTVVLEGVILLAIFSLGVGHFKAQKEERLTVLEMTESKQEEAKPKAPEPPKQELATTIQPPPTDIIAPPPKIEVRQAEQPVAAVAVAEVAAPAPPAQAPAAKAAPAPSAESSGPVKVSNLNTNLLSGAPPAYPNGSRRKREQGTVVLRLVISEDGRVDQISVSRSSGFEALDEAALAAVKKWRWSPTIRDGKPVKITGLVQIPFVLKDS